MSRLFCNIKRAYFLTVMAFLGITAVLIIYSLIFKELFSVFTLPISALFLLIPLIYSKLFKAQRLYLFDIKLLIFVFLSYNLGICMRLYHITSFYDVLAHFLSGIIFAQGGVCVFLIIYQGKEYAIKDKVVAILFGLFFCSFAASVWEIGEFAVSRMFGTDPQWVRTTGVSDTMEDIIVCVLGAMLYCVALGISLKKKNSKAIRYLSNGTLK